MRQASTFILLSIGLAGCVSTVVPAPPSVPVAGDLGHAALRRQVGPSPVSEAEKAAAFEAIRACLRNAADRLDDRRSDASTIATAAVSYCSPTIYDAQAIIWRGQDEGSRRELATMTRPGLVDHATRTVLERRALTRA